MYRQGAPITVGNVSIANVTSAPAGPPAPVNGQVTCSLHKKSRAIKFVQPWPIKNAEGTVVGYTYHCTEASPCLVGGKPGAMHGDDEKAAENNNSNPNEATITGDDADFDIDAPSQASNDGRPPAATMKKLGYDGVRTTTTGDAPAGGLAAIMAGNGNTAPKGLFGDSANAAAPAAAEGGRFTVATGSVAGRAPSRYYDMSKTRGDDDYKKVCWSCGMDSHEKPQCPNLLCRNCHDAQEPGYEGRMNHRCTRVGLSAFVLLDTDFLDNFMAAEELQKKKSAAESAVAAADADEKVDSAKARANPLLTLDEAAFVNPSLLTTRCPRCNQFGHMDCPHPSSEHNIIRAKLTDKKSKARLEKEEKESGMQRQLSCCGCASKDHSGYECPSRPRDYWRERVLGVAVGQLGMAEVRKIVAIDERVPQNIGSNNASSYNNNDRDQQRGGASSNYNTNTNGRNEERPFGGARPFGSNSAYSKQPASGGRRGRDDDSDGWSDDDRPARGGRRGEYDRSYNRNNGRGGGRGGRNNNYSDDDESEYSLDDSYSDDDSYRGGGNRRGGGRGGRGGSRHHTSHQGRLDARDHGRNTPSAPYRGNNGYGGGNNSNHRNGGGQYGGNNNNANRGGGAVYQRPGQQQQYQQPQQGGYRTAAPQQYHQQQGGMRAPANSYGAPYGGHQQPQQHHGGGGYSYSRPPPPPPNSQPGRGAYNKRGFEF